MAPFEDMACILVGRKGGRDEDHFVKPAQFPDLFGPPQVPQMDGVEGPSK
jgi:hypothetical protein